MTRNPVTKISVRGMILFILVIANALVLKTALITGNEWWYLALVITIPLLLILLWLIRKP
ncbi:hypothetical protein SAMN04488055_0906 [Chitinophaga niabensis]|uniref:Uncharacterized protein n=1 Tax=Chitinophaga niabensis TaxID=536979 RepID=A0A1N6DMC6_9BACT|nr:hypothetical protein SAMN04488055_0906 [Chitinophaga niabensis]